MPENIADAPPAQMEPRAKVKNPAELSVWLRNDILDWHTLGLFEKIERAKKVRSCYRPGKNKEGVKDQNPIGDKPFPWKGAPDLDSRIADELINEEVDFAILTWFSGEKIVRPRDVMDQDGTQRAEAWRHALDFYLDQNAPERTDAIELLFSSVEEIGFGVWKEGWRKRTRKGRKTAAFSDLVRITVEDAARTAQENYVPFTEEDAAMIEGGLIVALNDKAMKEELIMRIMSMDAAMTASEAAQVLMQWRSGDMDRAQYFAPIPEPGVPESRALVPGVDCVFPAMMQNHRKGRFWEFEWLTEAEVLLRAQDEDWDGKWTEKLLENPGLVVDWYQLGINNYTGQWLNGAGMNFQISTLALQHGGMYQIATLWQWGIDKDGHEAPYRTICHGKVDGYALHECDPWGDGEMHLRFVRRENKSNLAVDTMGVPDEVITQQVVEKQTTDLFACSAQLRGMPPRFKSMEESGDGLSPGAIIPVNNRFLQSGAARMFPELPDPHSQHVLAFLDLNRRRVNEFYRRGPEADPESRRARRMRKMHRASQFYREMLHLLALNIQRDIPDDGLFLGNVNGMEVNRLIRREDLDGRLDVTFHCDIATADLDLAEKKMEMATKAVSMFRNGEADFNQIGRTFLSWIDSRLLTTGVRNLQDARQAETDETNALIQKIVAGILVIDENNPLPPAGDPALRIQIIQQWASLAENQQIMMQRPLVMEQMQKLIGHYQFQIQQFQDNAAIGRTWGVNPELKNATPGAPVGGPAQAQPQPALMG